MSSHPLPLFPLETVLLPGATLPLHIFEDRYKALIGECLASGAEFGVNLSAEGSIAPVGCTAVVTRVTQRYPDGRLDVEVEGRRRYRVETTEPDRRPYLLGTVSFFGDREEPVDETLARETVDLYNTLVRAAYQGRVPEQEHVAGKPVSFFLARKAGMAAAQRQTLLEETTENGRLRLLRDYLVDVLPRIERANEIERIVRSDGYL